MFQGNSNLNGLFKGARDGHVKRIHIEKKDGDVKKEKTWKCEFCAKCYTHKLGKKDY